MLSGNFPNSVCFRPDCCPQPSGKSFPRCELAPDSCGHLQIRGARRGATSAPLLRALAQSSTGTGCAQPHLQGPARGDSEALPESTQPLPGPPCHLSVAPRGPQTRLQRARAAREGSVPHCGGETAPAHSAGRESPRNKAEWTVLGSTANPTGQRTLYAIRLVSLPLLTPRLRGP